MTGSLPAGPDDLDLWVSNDEIPTSWVAPAECRHVDSVVELTVPPGSSFAAVGRLVLAGVGARMELPIGEIGDLQRGIDVLLRQPATRDGVTIRLTPSVNSLEMAVGPLAVTPVDRVWLERVLTGLVEEIRWHDAAGRGDWISARMPRRSVDRARR